MEKDADREIAMDEDTIKALKYLRDVNEALITVLEETVYYMEECEEPNPEVLESSIVGLKSLIAQSDKFYRTKPTEH